MECSFEFELFSTYSDPACAEELFLNGKIRPLDDQQQAKSFKSIPYPCGEPTNCICIKLISETPTKNQRKIEAFDVDVSSLSSSNMEYCSFEFELVSTCSDPACAEELFFNGKIRPLSKQQQAESFKGIPHLGREHVEEKSKNKGLTTLRDLLWNEEESSNKSCISTIDEDKLLLIRQAIQESIEKCRDERNFSRPKQDTKNNDQNLRNNHVYDKKAAEAKSVQGLNGLAHQLQVYRSPGEKTNLRRFIFPYIQCVTGCRC